jgi:hypothetical protein
MQTFLPYPNFKESAKILDYRRLGKQRPEAKQLHTIVTTELVNSNRWKNQPLVMMWRNYPDALAFYYNCILEEWTKRGYKNNMPLIPVKLEGMVFPWWLGEEQYHSSHRATLLAKYPEFYEKYNWKEEPKLGYYWPERIGN